uniref:Uncharacterized protein n=1 Tax=Elaeophora elaphi TaxID=1147741 RepID=A0A158Q910_9BILA
MDRHDLLEHIRRQFLNDQSKANSRKSNGVEKATNRTRKFRVKCHEVPLMRNKFEENVMRKVQNIRTSVAFKQCCRRLNGYDDENIGVITKSYSSMPSLYTSKSVLRFEKNNCKKSMVCLRSEHCSTDICGSGSWMHKSSLTSVEGPKITKPIVNIDRLLRNGKMNSHLLQSTPLCTTNKMAEIKNDKIVQPQIAAVKSSDAFDCSAKSKMRASCEFSVTLLENTSPYQYLRASRFLEASFSNRLSISSLFESSKVNDESSFNDYTLGKHLYNDHLFPKQDIKDVTRGKILGCRLKAHIVYGRNVVEMSQHLRDVRDAFTSKILPFKHEVGDGRNSLPDERCFDRQSSFYATVQQRLNKALAHSSVPNNVFFLKLGAHYTWCLLFVYDLVNTFGVNYMHQLSQYPLKERNCSPIDLPISSLSIDSAHDNNDNSDNTKNVLRNTESEIAPETVVQQAKSSDTGRINLSPSTDSILNDVSQNDVLNSSLTYSSQESLKREHYANNTVKALRQFYKDSMLYFVELRKLCCQQRVENLWKIEAEEERIKATCLLLKRKYIDSVRSAMPMKNLVDYHLHETARIQLLNLDLQKHLMLLKDNKKNWNFEKFRHSSEKVLLLTKDFEKNILTNELERWERKLRTRSHGFKIDGNHIANIDNTRSLFSSPLRVVRKVREVKVQNPTSYNKNLQHLREELKWKRREADFLKRTFNQRVMRSDQRHVVMHFVRKDFREGNSLKAQIDAHVRYITETEKDIAQLMKLQNENAASDESYPAPSSKPTSMTSIGLTAEKTLDEEFTEVDESRTSFSAEVHPTNKSCSSEGDPKKRIVESIQFSKFVLKEKSETDNVTENYKNLHSAGKATATYPFRLYSSNTLTPRRLTSPEQLTEQSPISNYGDEKYGASDEALLSIDNKLLCSQDIPMVPKDAVHLIIDSSGSNRSSELFSGETVSFKQDVSKEAVLMSVVSRSNTINSQVEQQDQSAVQLHRTIDENETVADQCSLPSKVVDEQYFTPLSTDIETDSEEKSDNGVEEKTVASQESSSSFHSTTSLPTPDEQFGDKIVVSSLFELFFICSGAT